MSNKCLYTKETVKQWLRNIFSLCDPVELEDILDYDPANENDKNKTVIDCAVDPVIDYAVDHYIDLVYPKIFDHFESQPYMSGHDESGEFFEHEYLCGKSLELDYNNLCMGFDGNTEYIANDVCYLVSNGDIERCVSFYFKSNSVEVTLESKLDTLLHNNKIINMGRELDVEQIIAHLDGIAGIDE